jgi:hypothetical protein
MNQRLRFRCPLLAMTTVRYRQLKTRGYKFYSVDFPSEMRISSLSRRTGTRVALLAEQSTRAPLRTGSLTYPIGIATAVCSRQNFSDGITLKLRIRNCSETKERLSVGSITAKTSCKACMWLDQPWLSTFWQE